MAQAGTIAKETPFVWEGKDRKGNKVTGRSVAASEQALRADLRRQGVVATRIKKQGSAFKTSKKPGPEDIAIFFRQLATMLTAGIPLVQAFEIVGAGHEKPSVQKLILDIKSQVESGTTLHDALRKHPLYFDDLSVNLVEAGEQAGALENLLDKIATYKEKTEAIKKKIKKALFYPTAVIAVAILVCAVILIFVVPTFEETFDELRYRTALLHPVGHRDVAVHGQLVVADSRRGHRRGLPGHVPVQAIAGVPACGRQADPAGAGDRTDHAQLVDRAFCPHDGRDLQGRRALVEALETVAGATGNSVYEKAVLRMRDDVSVGYPLNMAMKQTQQFPHMVVQMTAIGEEAGALDNMLFKVAEYYEQEVNNAVDALSSLIEPFIMVIIGVLVGGLVVALYLPIFKVAATVAG